MLRRNSYVYRFCEVNQKTTRRTLGYTGDGNVSANGLLTVGDKRDTDITTRGMRTPTKPRYMGELPNWPFATHEEALIEIRKQATTEGGDDGWAFDDDE